MYSRDKQTHDLVIWSTSSFAAFSLRYLCLLANPQNSVDSWLQATDLLVTPFALALQRSSHVLVIPNKSISVYSRLWCVYEAYLGVAGGKKWYMWCEQEV